MANVSRHAGLNGSDTATPHRLAVLISGNGSNLQAIIDHIDNGQLTAEVVVVISDQAEAYGLTRASRHSIPAITVSAADGETRAAYDTRLQCELDAYQADWIILAGFMRILSAEFVLRYLGRLVNIHPALLPAYKGLDTHRRVLQAGEKRHGASVHFVTPELDSGPIIQQEWLHIEPHETVEHLTQRIHRIEHRIYPQVIKLLCERRLRYVDGQITLDGKTMTAPTVSAMGATKAQ